MAIRKYRVRQGFTYGAFGQWASGTILELEETVAQHSLDKLELAEVVQNVPPPAPPPVEIVPPEEPVTDETGIEQPSLPRTPKKLRKKSGD